MNKENLIYTKETEIIDLEIQEIFSQTISKVEELGIQQTLQKYQKVQPPFSNLRSLLATAIVLSYYGKDYQVKCMMKALTRTSCEYININKLLGFLVKGLQPNQLSLTLNLYHKSDRGRAFRYPDAEILRKMKHYEKTNEIRIIQLCKLI